VSPPAAGEPRYRPTGSIVLRTPLLPLSELLALAGEQPEAKLREIVSRPVVRDALFVASPELDGRVDAWLAGDDGERDGKRDGKRDAKLTRALLRYVARMCGRSSPFGLFAGCTTGTFAGRTELALASVVEQRPCSRLDMAYLCALVECLGVDPEIRAALRYHPSETLYAAPDGELRYIAAMVSGGRRTYRLMALRATQPLTDTLARAAAGATPGDLAGALAGDGIESERARRFVSRLIERRILISNLDLPITGPDPVAALTVRLRGLPGGEQTAQLLESTVAELEELDRQPPGSRSRVSRRLTARLSEAAVPVDPGRLIQVDTIKPGETVHLGEPVLAALRDAIDLIGNVVAGAEPAELVEFRRRFEERYVGAAVPLLEALDEEAGIGLLDPGAADPAGMLTGAPRDGSAAREAWWVMRHRICLELIERARRMGELEVELTAEDIEGLSADAATGPPLPNALAVLAVLAADSPAAVDRGEFELEVRTVSGPSGAQTLARFCHADDDLRKAVAGHLRAEEALDPDAAFAEVVHLPADDAGNVLLRPLLRDWEIPFLGASGAEAGRQLPLSDLLVSVEGEAIVLRSRRLGRRVVPCVTTAFDFRRPGVTLFRFLGSLQFQLSGGRWWSWGALEDAPFRPRLRHGRVILCRAQWRLSRGELRALAASGASGAPAALQRLRAERGLPRLVTLAEDDQELPIDLDGRLSAETFVHLVRGREEVTLTELWPGPDRLVVSSPEGRLVHELLVPMLRTAPLPPPLVSASAPATPARFPPGSEWTSVNLYCGPAGADRLLRDVIRPFAESVIGTTADRWHFLRFSVPEWHLRVRFRGNAQRLIPELLAAADHPLAWRVQLDTYVREAARYGGEAAIELVEQIFSADSDAVAAIIAATARGDPGLRERRQLALAGVDQLLEDFLLPGDRALALLRAQADFLRQEFGLGKAAGPWLGGRLRQERTELERLLERPTDPAHPLAHGFVILAARSERIRPLAAQLRELAADGRVGRSVDVIVETLAHLHVNRLLRSSHRAQELLICDELLRLRVAQAARRAAGHQPDYRAH